MSYSLCQQTETDGTATPARDVVQRSKHPREHTGSRCGEGIACKVLQGMYAPACVRLRGRCASGCAARGRRGEPSHATHVHPICICTCAVCVRTCVQQSPHRHLHFHGHPQHILLALVTKYTFQVVGQPSCKRLVLKSLRLLLLQETRWLDGQASQALTSALREGWETCWADGDGNCFWRSLSLSI